RQRYRPRAAASSDAILAVPVAIAPGSLGNPCQVREFRDRHDEDPLPLRNEDELLTGLPMLLLADGFGNGNLELAGQRGSGLHIVPGTNRWDKRKNTPAMDGMYPSPSGPTLSRIFPTGVSFASNM